MNEETGKMELPGKEKAGIQLIFEEAMTKLLDYADDNDLTIEVTPRRFIGSISFSIKIPGREFDFMDSIRRTVSLNESEMSPEMAESINNILLGIFKNRLKYSHRNGYNYIQIFAVQSPYSSLIKTIIAIILAFISGALLKGYASPELCSNLVENIFTPIVSVLIDGMKMCTVPLVFCSLVSCISRFGNLSDMRNLGIKCLSLFFSAQFICVHSWIIMCFSFWCWAFW